ncbi:MAG: proline--tRNA ligase [archaeon GB-1867-005]|nr:proline--tRNA ligase [Candidatus Culexmicrobium cathedralense]
MSSPSRERWSSNFSEWYREVLDGAELYDYRYPLKGCGVWRPYGFKLRRNVLKILRSLLDSTGHEEILLPLLIPETLLAKEAAHVRGFEGQVYWVTRGGFDELDVKLALRPTSETALAPMLKLWVKAHTDLPLKIYQVVSVFRYETKATRPLIRVREITTFKEAHTAHASLEDAERQVKEAVEIYSKFFDQLGVPYAISVRPEWDKFAGAIYTIAFDTIMPDGRVMQIGTVHNLGQNFSKAFEIEFLKPDGTHDYVWQTCYGISERVIAALISVHGDDRGLILPPNVAPIQIVIIPIPYKGVEEVVDKMCRKVYSMLSKAGFRVKYDDREGITPGSKFYDWELRGVPLRVEIGPKDVEEETITISRRDTLERTKCKVDDAVRILNQLMKDIQDKLKKRAWNWFKSKISRASSLEEVKAMLGDRKGIIEITWCGKEECGLKAGEEADARVLGEAIDLSEKVSGKCVVCGEKATKILRLAKAY